MMATEKYTWTQNSFAIGFEIVSFNNNAKKTFTIKLFLNTDQGIKNYLFFFTQSTYHFFFFHKKTIKYLNTITGIKNYFFFIRRFVSRGFVSPGFV